MTTDKIKDLITRCYDAAVERGDYKCPECEGANLIQHKGMSHNCYCPKCNGTGIDPNKNIGALLCDVVEELMDAKRAFREGRAAVSIKSTPGDKLASAVIRLFEICGYLGIEKHIEAKLAYRRQRES